MNILELNVEHLETLNDLFSVTICKKNMIKDYLFAEISTKCFQSTIYQCS